MGGLWEMGSCPPVMPGMAVKAMTAVPMQYTNESPTIVLYLPRKGKDVHTAACKRYRSFVKRAALGQEIPRGEGRAARGARIQRCQHTTCEDNAIPSKIKILQILLNRTDLAEVCREIGRTCAC